MRSRIPIAFAIAALLAAAHAGHATPPAYSTADEPSTPAVKLKVKPTCDHDKDGPFQWEVPRVDLTVNFRVRILASGAVDEVTMVDYQPQYDTVEQLGRRFAACWRREARYDTAGIEPKAFPMTRQLKVTWKARP